MCRSLVWTVPFLSTMTECSWISAFSKLLMMRVPMDLLVTFFFFFLTIHIIKDRVSIVCLSPTNGNCLTLLVCMLIHIGPFSFSCFSIEVTYTGKASHAAGFPWEGVNALDAAVSCYNNISCLRQQMKPDWRVHCKLYFVLFF